MGLNLRAGQKAIMAVARYETRNMGQCLQAGIMATPRAGANELGGSATAVRPAVEAGEEKLIWGTCWARSVRVTERATVTVTEREKTNWGDRDVHEGDNRGDGRINYRDAGDGNDRGKTTR